MRTKISELRSKDVTELKRLVEDKQRELRSLTARALAHNLKGVRQVRALKREVARLLTLISEKRIVTAD